MLACGVVAAAIWNLLSQIISPSFRLSCFQLYAESPTVGITLLIIIVAAIVWPMGKGRWLAFLGIKEFWRYPPLWTAVLFGFVSLEVINKIADAPRLSTDVTLLQLLTAIWVFVIFMQLLSRDMPNREKVSGKILVPTANIEDYLDWISNDLEVTDPAEDRFGHAIIARRIANRLSVLDQEAPTIAVVGSLGSGKSTIGNFVSKYIKDQQKIIFVRFSAWPYDSPEAAVRGVLNELIKNLGARVNTLALSGLADNYVSAIEKARGIISGIVNLVRGDYQPNILLERISNVINAVDCRLVLWIEDLERFSGIEQLGEEGQRAIRDVERLGALRALFHLIDRKPNISVIIADSTLEARFDIDKIARFVERPPRLIEEKVKHCIAGLRNSCINDSSKPIIDTATSEQRRKLMPLDSSESTWDKTLKDFYGSVSPIEALTELVQTPRVLKFALRLSKDSWDKLAGELDFDDILVASVLKVVRPEMFSFIDKNIKHFRSGFELGGERKENNVTYQFYQSLLKNESIDEKKSLEVLIEYLFPKVSSNSHLFNSERLQGVAQTVHVDYWDRYLSEPEIEATYTDQSALQAIRNWQLESENDLVSRVLDPDRHLQVEHFVSFFQCDELCILLEQVTDRIATMPDTIDPKPGAKPGITSVWRMIGDCAPDQTLLVKTLMRLVEKYVPICLPVVEEIIHYFNNTGDSVPDRLNADNRTLLTNKLYEVIRNEFVEDKNGALKLLDALCDGSPYMIYWLSWGLQRIRADQTKGDPFSGWKKFSSVLLDAAEIDKKKVIPYLISFVTNVLDDGSPQRLVFDNESAKRLFDYERLMKMLSQAQTNEDLENDINSRIILARDTALKKLAKGL